METKSGINYIRLKSGHYMRFVDEDPVFSRVILESGGPSAGSGNSVILEYMMTNLTDNLAKALLHNFSSFIPIHQNMVKHWFSYFVEGLLNENDEELITQWLAALGPLGFKLEDDTCVVLENEEQLYQGDDGVGSLRCPWRCEAAASP